MMIFSLVAIIGLEKCYITSAYLQLLCHSGERAVARGPFASLIFSDIVTIPVFYMEGTLIIATTVFSMLLSWIL